MAEVERIGNLDPHRNLASEAAAEELGGHVRYVIDERVSLPRQKSALLPLLDKQIEATRVTIFNEAVHNKFPVLGLRVKNTSGQPLTQGPVTVYEDSGYAGDARLPDLQPNEERLISYAIDLGTEIKSETRRTEGPAMTVSVIGDRLHVHYTARETRKYSIRNRSAHDRLLIVEHPLREGWDLAGGQKPRETSRELYRFDLPVAAGKDVVFEVAEEQPRDEQFAGKALPDLDRDGIRRVYFGTGLNLHVELASRDLPSEAVRVRVVKGIVQVTSRSRVEQAYHVINGSETDRRDVTLRHRAGKGWHIVAGEKPQEASLDSHDFSLRLAPGKDGRVDVVNERDSEAAWPGGQTSIAELEKLLRHPALSASVKAALTKILAQRQALEEQKQQTAEVEKRLKDIAEEQDRLRKNLASLPPTSAAHKRYLEKFDRQETEIEGLQEQLKKLKAAEKLKQNELAELLPTLNAN